MLTSASKILLSVVLLGILVFALAPGNWTPAWVVNHDKFSHMVVFFILAFLFQFAFPIMKMIKLLAMLVFFAVLIEYLQLTFFNRGFSSVDILYDLLGIGLFLALKGSVPFLVEFIPYKKGTASFKANE